MGEVRSRNDLLNKSLDGDSHQLARVLALAFYTRPPHPVDSEIENVLYILAELLIIGYQSPDTYYSCPVIVEGGRSSVIRFQLPTVARQRSDSWWDNDEFSFSDLAYGLGERRAGTLFDGRQGGRSLGRLKGSSDVRRTINIS